MASRLLVETLARVDQHADESASCAPLQAVDHGAVEPPRGAKMPGVSTKISCATPFTAMPRMSARVVCTLCETIVTLEPTSVLSRVDLPALGAPIRATKPQRVLSIGRSCVRHQACRPRHRHAPTWRRRRTVRRRVWMSQCPPPADGRATRRQRGIRDRGAGLCAPFRGRPGSASRGACAHSCSMVLGSRNGRSGLSMRSFQNRSTKVSAAL